MKKLILAFVLLFSLNSFAEEELTKDYQIDQHTWSIDLILDTCLDQFKKEAKAMFPSNRIVIVPKTIGYSHFTVKVRRLDGQLAVPQKEVEFQFAYWTNDDHTKCTRIDPHDYVY